MTDTDSWENETVTVESNGIHYMMCSKDNLDNSSTQYEPIELPQRQKRDEYEILQSHTLMIRNASKGQIFACVKCKVHYASAQHFKMAHDIEVKQENLKEELELIEEPLWEAIPEDLDVKVTAEENLIIEEIIEDTGQENDEEQCYNCLQCGISFHDLDTAQDHACEEIIESNDPEVLEAEESFNDIIDESVDITDTVQKLNTQIIGKYTKNETEIFTCEICNISFRAERYLIGHRKIHNERPMRSIEQALPPNMKQNYPQCNQFYCEICDKSFDSNLLLVHKNMHLSNENSQNTCNICNRDFYSAESYEMHMKVHAGQLLHKHAQTEQSENNRASGRFKCQYCDKYFKRPYEKLSHERVHTGEKPYACEVCGKRFRVSYSLTMHLRTHTDMRPYECEICHKRFKSQPVYAHHKRIHSNERSFQCETCNKTFQTTVQLSAHRNSHSKPFKCTICQNAFAALYLLRSHMQAHQSEAEKEPTAQSLGLFKCEICGTAYMRKLSLRQHMKKQHGISAVPSQEMFLNNLNDMDLLDTHFLAEKEEIITDHLSNDDNDAYEPDELVDEQSALLIAVANAAEEFQFEQQRCLESDEMLY